ncbi:hypothetical protein BIW11_03086 [Tropilaelaps mercedesae]|uniref:Uncharacterized protein n=1 Tax=Tropilaelaps mercedesae TaxID=418985 RepID=A0A1V9XSF9_9ACAR|nr:hypothetical protein BIW11_03086 [Tropilaelaps mercedesae]
MSGLLLPTGVLATGVRAIAVTAAAAAAPVTFWKKALAHSAGQRRKRFPTPDSWTTTTPASRRALNCLVCPAYARQQYIPVTRRTLPCAESSYNEPLQGETSVLVQEFVTRVSGRRFSQLQRRLKDPKVEVTGTQG